MSSGQCPLDMQHMTIEAHAWQASPKPTTSTKGVLETEKSFNMRVVYQ